uniref:Uncharacterized protein n=1 Tax=Tanacetum cinerariifolium TaxID=118510 RepID=A0A6L2LV06_TANCI|nr:hypothetical protein [Tanacetum cinerariifolium]
MNQDNAHMVAASKVPMLKPGEFEIWRMKIKQYIQMIDYALWEVIKNGVTLPKIQVVEGIPNEHQLKFNSIKDVKQLLEAIEKRFGGNAATKMTQRNLLKQKYKNFIPSSSKMLDQTFDRIQKLVSQLGLFGEKLSQKDVNQKLLRSLSPEWNTHDVVWKNKADLDTMSMDDLYNNLKVYEPEVKGMSLKRIGRKLTFNGNETIDFDKSNVECYNYHKRRHFARECKAPRNQNNKHKESSKRSVPLETTNSTALVSCDGFGGYDWSDQAEEGPNCALMAFASLNSDSKVSNDSICSKSCLETVKLLKSQNEQLLKDLKKSELMVLGYKTSLKSVEERLEFFKKNEFIYLEDIKVLKVEIQMKKIAIKELRRKLEIAQKEKDRIQLTIDKLENASKGLNKLIECQIVDNCKKGLGYENYNAVLPPYTRNFMPSTLDLSYTSLDEFANKTVAKNTKYSKEETKIEKKTVRPSIVKEEFVKPRQQEKTARKTVKKVEHNRQNIHRPREVYEMKVTASSRNLGKGRQGGDQGACKVFGCLLGNFMDVLEGALFTQGMVSSIPSGGSISLEGFLPPILLLVMIIAMVVVTVVVVAVVGGVPSILKLSVMVIGFLYRIVFQYLLY